MNYVLEGIIFKIGTTEKFASGFKKREIIIRNDDDFTQDIKVEFVNDNCDKLDLFIEGEQVKVAFTLIGNEYQGKYYTNLRGVAIGEIVTKDGNKIVKSRYKKNENTKKSDDDLDF
jgi:single-strand DNA-binding protein